MANCEIIEKCQFFQDKLVSMPTTASMMMREYCHGSNAECARYIVFKAHGSEKVPPDLYPSEFARAVKMTY